MMLHLVVKICLIFFPICFGDDEDLKYTVVITSDSKPDCNALIRTSFVLQTLCSCVMSPKGNGLAPISTTSIKVITGTGIKLVSQIVPHPRCMIMDKMYVYNSALVFLETQIDLMGIHSPVREPAFPWNEFDSAMKLRMPCAVVGARRISCQPAHLSDCINVTECTETVCHMYLTYMTFCMMLANTSKPAILGAPLVCTNGLVWGMKLLDNVNFTLFMKTMVFDELEKSSANNRIVRDRLLLPFLLFFVLSP